jgi:hypothetical protein
MVQGCLKTTGQSHSFLRIPHSYANSTHLGFLSVDVRMFLTEASLNSTHFTGQNSILHTTQHFLGMLPGNLSTTFVPLNVMWNWISMPKAFQLSRVPEQGNPACSPKCVYVCFDTVLCHLSVLHQAGKTVFTLPICIRSPDAPGYPPSDEGVYQYFSKLTKDHDLSLSAHQTIACFLGAVHKTMLKRLQEKRNAGYDGTVLLKRWHEIMEEEPSQKYRNAFFLEVVEKAKSVSGVSIRLSAFIHNLSKDGYRASRPKPPS